jgi:hypothetical protein
VTWAGIAALVDSIVDPGLLGLELRGVLPDVLTKQHRRLIDLVGPSPMGL